MLRLLGETEAAELFTSLALEPIAGLRVNTNKISSTDFKALSVFQLSPIPWTESGFFINTKARAGKHAFHEAGLYYLQEPSAMAVAESLAPKAGEWVLDLAAAPGGKSTHLLSLMQDQGLLIANEVQRKRAQALLENLERYGARQAVVVTEELSRLADSWKSSFDRVLLDAPCSGEGMFRKSAEALSMWSEAVVKHCASRQEALLAEAAKMVKPGGYLAYSTCTFSPEENEQCTDRFLSKNPTFTLEPIPLAGLSTGQATWANPARAELNRSLRLWPHKHRGEGHFVALLKKAEAETSHPKLHTFKEAPTKAIRLWQDFAAGSELITYSHNKALSLFGDRLFALPESTPNLQGLQAMRAGLCLGWVHKDRFEPSHALALALSKQAAESFNHLDLDLADERLERYLKGDVIEAQGAKGWVLICVQGYPLGWGKRSAHVIKNARPRGLRWL